MARKQRITPTIDISYRGAGTETTLVAKLSGAGDQIELRATRGRKRRHKAAWFGSAKVSPTEPRLVNAVESPNPTPNNRSAAKVKTGERRRRRVRARRSRLRPVRQRAAKRTPPLRIAGHRPIGNGLLVAVATLVVGTASAGAFMMGSWMLAAALHSLLALGLGGLIWRQMRRSEPDVLVVVAAGAGIFCGVLGGAAALLYVLLSLVYQSRARSFEDWHQHIFGTMAVPASTTLTDALHSERERPMAADSVASLVSILNHGTLSEKHAAMAVLSRNYDASFHPALVLAKRSDDLSVRVQAATASAWIERRYTERLLKGQSALLKNRPGLQVAQTIDEYAYSGVADENRQAQLRRDARNLLLHHLTNVPEDEAARFALGRLHVRQRDFDAALKIFAQPGKADPSKAWQSWHAECLFATGDYCGLRSLMGQDETLAEPLEAVQSSWRAGNSTSVDEVNTTGNGGS